MAAWPPGCGCRLCELLCQASKLPRLAWGGAPLRLTGHTSALHSDAPLAADGRPAGAAAAAAGRPLAAAWHQAHLPALLHQGKRSVGGLVGWLPSEQRASPVAIARRAVRLHGLVGFAVVRQAWPACKAACSVPNPHVPPLFSRPDFLFLRRLLAWRCATGRSSTPACLPTRALWCATAT